MIKCELTLETSVTFKIMSGSVNSEFLHLTLLPQLRRSFDSVSLRPRGKSFNFGGSTSYYAFGCQKAFVAHLTASDA